MAVQIPKMKNERGPKICEPYCPRVAAARDPIPIGPNRIIIFTNIRNSSAMRANPLERVLRFSVGSNTVAMPRKIEKTTI